MIVAVIPARGGSKGIPHKNIVPVGGKPLIAWSIEQAKRSQVDATYVITDSQEIAEVAAECGVVPVGRSEQSATDDAPSEECISGWINRRLGNAPDAVVMLQATSPIRQPDDIDNAIDMFRKSGADSLFSARVVEGYIWRDGSGVLSPTYGQRLPRQMRTVRTLEENGSIYIFKPHILQVHGSRLGGKVVPYIMHPLDSFQVDEPADIPFIESLMELRLGYHAAASH